MNRELHMVIQSMLEIIPEDHDDLINDLQSKYNSVIYAAPEMQYVWWHLVHDTLNQYVFGSFADFSDWIDYIQSTNQHWKEEIRQIWTGERYV